MPLVFEIKLKDSIAISVLPSAVEAFAAASFIAILST